MENVLIVFLGLVIGSFINVLTYRLPDDKSILRPGSHCPACKTSIKWYDNVPVLSFLVLRGRCRSCNGRISPLYPCVEIFAAFSFWLAYVHFNEFPLYTAAAAVFLTLLITLAIIDFNHLILPDELTIGGSILFLAFSFIHPHIHWLESILTALGGSLIFAGLYYFYLKVRKIEGLGFGDVKMMILLGAFLGLNNTVITLLIASFSGLLVGLFFIVYRKANLKYALPFGSFLAFGAFIALFWGHHILKIFGSLFR